MNPVCQFVKSNFLKKSGFLFLLLTVFLFHGYAQPGKKNKKNKTPKVITIDPSVKAQIDLMYVDASTDALIGSTKKAIEDFYEILKLHPAHYASMYNIAKLYLETSGNPDDINDALQLIQKAVKGEPDNYWYYHLWVEICKKQMDFSNAIKVQKQITEKFPKEYRVMNTLADLYAKNKEYDNALSIIQKLETLHDYYDEELGIQKYKLCIDAGKPDIALTTIDKLIGANPNKPEYYYAKYTILSKINRTEEGIKVLLDYLKKSPNDGFSLLTLADYYKNKNNIEESDKYLFRAFANPEIAIDGKANVVNSMLSFIPKEPALKPRVMKLIGILVSTHPEHPSAKRMQGDLYSLQNRPDSAHYFYKMSVVQEGAQLEVWNKLLESAFKMHDYEALREDVTEALEYFPNNDNFYYYMGMANLGLKDYEQATYAFEKVKKRGASTPLLTARVYAGTGTLNGISNKKQDAENDFQKALSLAPDDPLVLSQYSVYLSTNAIDTEMTKATRMAEKAVQIAPEIPETHYALALALYTLGLYDKAEEEILKSINLCETADYLEKYGDILFRKDKKQEAVKQWEKAIAKGNKTIIVKDKLNQ
ncbi:MAG: hypothetical protein K1X92_09250 [Bacteroidia bacterium]|nr:hypothetical protein [Bacteroidia bacterium]